jgi:hypothetical protein
MGSHRPTFDEFGMMNMVDEGRGGSEDISFEVREVSGAKKGNNKSVVGVEKKKK